MLNETNYEQFKEMQQERVKLEKKTKNFSRILMAFFAALVLLYPGATILIVGFIGTLGLYSVVTDKMANKFHKKYAGLPTHLSSYDMQKKIEDYDFHLHEVEREKRHNEIKERARKLREEKNAQVIKENSESYVSEKEKVKVKSM